MTTTNVVLSLFFTGGAILLGWSTYLEIKTKRPIFVWLMIASSALLIIVTCLALLRDYAGG